MTAMGNVGIAAGSSDVGPSSADNEIEALKLSLEDQRRRSILLNADLQRQIEAREAIQAQLMEAHSELAASRDRRKEMARVITRLNAQLEDRFEELAVMQRHLMRWSPAWWLRNLFRRLRALRDRARSA
jgi:septal ring factor EnvC (AmiA/AmiB activator)